MTITSAEINFGTAHYRNSTYLETIFMETRCRENSMTGIFVYKQHFIFLYVIMNYRFYLFK